jgi:NAD-dependent DNA ligase
MSEEIIVKKIKELENNIELARKIPITILAKIIKYATDKYYNTQVSIISDELFDFLIDVLKERSPKNKVLTQIGAPITEKIKIKLPFHMGSLNKIKPGGGLNKWIEKNKGHYSISDKLDGISGLLHKKGNKINLYTRGDGTYGTDISYLIPHIKSIKIDKLPENISIRGELIISKIKFKKYENTMANGRNMVAGIVNAKTFDPTIVNDIEFICYELIENIKHSEQINLLQSYGLKCVYNSILYELNDNILNKLLEKRKKESEYEIDGIVIFDNNIHPKNKSGNPDYGFAFKSLSSLEYADVQVIDIEWNLSKDGLIKPIVKIIPTKISGVIISNVTGHNAKNIIDNKISKGSIIRIVRSGDVIPYIVEVIKFAPKIQYPVIPYKWNESGVDLIYDKNIEDEIAVEQLLMKNLTNFFKKIGTKWIDENTIIKFINAGYLSIKEIIKATKDDLLELESFGEKMAEKIYNSIQESLKDIELVDIMNGSNIFGNGFGKKKLGAILKVYPDIVDKKINKDKLIDMIKKIDGFDDKTAIKFSENIDEFCNFLKELNVTYENKFKEMKVGNKFKNMNIVFTGFRDKELEEKIINEGGKIVTSVSKNTNLIICIDKNESSNKMDKAKNLNIKIMLKDEFIKKYNI